MSWDSEIRREGRRSEYQVIGACPKYVNTSELAAFLPLLGRGQRLTKTWILEDVWLLQFFAGVTFNGTRGHYVVHEYCVFESIV